MKRVLKFFSFLFVSVHVAVPVIAAMAVRGAMTYNDYPLMIYFQRRALQFFFSGSNLWGYDPFYSAGFPLNFTWNSNLDLQFLQVLLHPVPEHLVLLGAFVASVASAPFTFRAGLRNFGITGARRDFATIIMLAYWWTGLPVVMMLLGMPSALFVFHLSFYVVSLYHRWLHDCDSRAVPWLYVLTPLCFIAHKTAIITVGVPVLLLICINVKSTSFRRLANLAAIGALTLAVNSFWLVPFLNLVKYKVALADAPHGLSTDPLRIFKDYFTLTKIMGHKVQTPASSSLPLIIMNTILRDALLALGVAGMVRLYREHARRISVFFSAFTVLFLAEIYFGSFWKPAAELNPTRYIGYLDSYLAIPATIGAAALWARLNKPQEGTAYSENRKLRSWATVSLFVLFIVSLAHFAIFSQQTATPMDKDTRELTEQLMKLQGKSGRVMLEDSGWNDRDGGPPRYAKGHFPSLLSDITGLEFIGGPYPYVFLKHHYADFHDGKFLGKPLSSFDDAALDKSMDLYDIRWIVCWSKECSSRFSSTPARFKKLTVSDKFNVYERVAFKSNMFIVGSGFTHADTNGIQVFRARPADGIVVLKYHAFDRLRVSGNAETGVYKAGDDPVGFISVKNPKPGFSIRNDYFEDGIKR